MRLTLTLLLALAVSACALRGPPLPVGGPAGALPGTAATGSPQGAVSPVPEPPPSAPPRSRMGPAASALLGQAHTQAASGEFAAAGATLERALRIEPDNPLLWVELGRLQLQQGNAAQADGMGRKALALASGEADAQAAAWTLIADSLRARGRNAEAADAERHADAPGAH
jgi:Tfp pilus assembly protein PilF